MSLDSDPTFALETIAPAMISQATEKERGLSFGFWFRVVDRFEGNLHKSF